MSQDLGFDVDVDVDMTAPATGGEQHVREQAVLDVIGPHAYHWTGRSPDTCAATSADGSSMWCGLPEASRVHEQRSGTDRRETVDHPAHYGGADNPYEVIKVLAEWMTPEQFAGFCIGNAIKYIGRAGKKDVSKEVEDWQKARWYLDRAIQHRQPSPGGPG